MLVTQEKRNKLIANFNETPYTVTYRRNKSRVTAQNKGGHVITSNVSYKTPQEQSLTLTLKLTTTTEIAHMIYKVALTVTGAHHNDTDSQYRQRL